MTNAECELLRQIAAEVERIELVPEYLRRYRGLQSGIARIQGDWIGPSPAERQMRWRTLRKLADAGLIDMFARWGERVTHCKLTDSGREAVAKLRAADQPVQATVTTEGIQ